VRTGDETIIFGEDGKPVISEELCVGCGICINRCPFDAIMIIGLPEALKFPTHRYGPNGFALYGLPVPQKGRVPGILAPNGIGKSTAVQYSQVGWCPISESKEYLGRCWNPSRNCSFD
jgi:ATP-binding cassette subfamily E protein 1